MANEIAKNWFKERLSHGLLSGTRNMYECALTAFEIIEKQEEIIVLLKEQNELIRQKYVSIETLKEIFPEFPV
jgi:DNA repair protein RadC